MTLPYERTNAVNNTREFLLKLLHASSLIPEEIKRQSHSLLKHYPHEYEMEMAGEKCPDIFSSEGYKNDV